MSSKIDRAKYGPSWTEVTLGAVLSVGIGALLAAVWLVLKPVEKVRELPEETVPGVVYFIEGSRNGSIGASWMQKSQLFITGRTVDLIEQDLNEAARQMTSAARSGKDKEEGMITPGQLNFRIREGELQIALPLSLDVYGQKAQVPLVARGGFAKKGDHFVYEANSIYLGSCAIERIPVLGDMLLGKIWEAMAGQEEVKAAWNALEDVTLDGRRLRLVAAR